MRIKERLATFLALPKEIILNLPVVTLTGGNECTIENYKGIVEFVQDKVRIRTGSGMLVIEGRTLWLKRITAEMVTVTGDIKKVELSK